MVFLERTKTSLTLAVMLKDDLSPDKKTIGDVFLNATGVRKGIIKHSTGYFLLVNLPDGEHILTGSGRFYKPANITIDTKSINPKQPFADITLAPKSNYPFPDGLTVLKGKIVDAGYMPLSQASIKINSMPESSTSEEDGGFFIQFAGDDWEKELDAFWNTDVDVPAAVTVDGRTYRDVGVHYRGMSSFLMVPPGYLNQ